MRIASFNIQSIVSYTKGHLEGDEKGHIVSNISIDSRSEAINSKTLFVALKGEHSDGHKHIKEAHEKGCKTFLVEKPIDIKGANFIVVDNTLKALQNLATEHRKTLNIPVVGITGSYGKTTVKEWLCQLLQNKFNIARSPKSYNSQIGVPLSVLSIRKEHNLALIEAGISQPGEMANLRKIIQPTIGVFTGIGKAHEENFSSIKEKEQEKKRLFQEVEKVVSIEDIQPKKLVTPFTDSASIINATLAHKAAIYLGLDKNEAKRELKNLKSLALRMELIKGKRNNIIVNDSYNSDENGLEIALDFLKQKSEGKEMIVVTSFENPHTKNLKERYKIKNWIVVNSKEGQKEVKKTLKELSNAAILIKGTHDSFFQNISRKLQQTNHTTSLEIDLSALTNNIKVFRKKLKPQTQLMLMVKAFGYGGGSVELAKHLQKIGADYLGVAYATEGEDLRKANVKSPIMVMSPEQSSFSTIIENDLEPEVYSLEVLDAFIRELISYGKKEYPIHLKIDTGMNRQGFQEHEIQELCQTINAQPEVNVKSVFSHLAAADEEKYSDFTEKQALCFDRISTQIEKEIGTNFLRHLLNTHGIINYPQHQYDLVRLGIGMFGEDFSGKIKEKLQNVATFKTTITQVKHVKKGESIGYGRGTILTEDKTIGILPVGYADGYFRALSNKAEVFVCNKKTPVVGNVCMDITMIDLTNVNAKVGDKVELFGNNISLTDLAEKANTISYEILTSISSRVKRVYLSE